MTSPMDDLPLDFVLVGPKRTGTTWAHAYLAACDLVFLPRGVKETFAFDRHHARGRERYLSLFDLPQPLPHGAVVGEVSPSYFPSPEVAARLREAAPACRIVVTLRHPYRRLVSAYYHHQQSGTIPPSMPLDEAVEAIPFLVDEGRYATHIRTWRERFGADGVHVLFLEDLHRDPEAFAGRLCAAIGLEPAPQVPERLLGGRVGAGERPRSYRLSRLARRTAARLRERDHFGLVRLGRRLGLRRLLMEGRPLPKEDPPIPEPTKRVLREEAEALAEFGVHPPDWKL